MKKFKTIISALMVLVAICVFPLTTNAAASESQPIVITPPNDIVHEVNGVYTVSFGVEHYYDLVDMRFAKGELGNDGYNSASVVTSTTFDIPAEESDSWYTFYVKDVNDNMSSVKFYAYCEKEDTPPECVEDASKHIVKKEDGTCGCEDGYTQQEDGSCVKDEAEPITITPTATPTATPTPISVPVETPKTTTIITPAAETPGCPDGQTMDANGKCYTPNTSCPDGYTKNANGTCVLNPTECNDNQVLDANGNCVDKVATLPQTGGLDALMLFFLFGCGLGVCGVGLLVYSKKKK